MSNFIKELVWLDNPDQQVREMAKELVALKRSGKREAIRLSSGHILSDYQYKLRHYITHCPWFLFRCVLNMHFLDEELHGKEILGFWFREQDAGSLTDAFDKLLAIPRGHGKTQMCGAGLAVWRIARQPEIKLNYTSATDGLTKNVGNYISGQLTGNQSLQAAFPDTLPPAAGEPTRWGTRGYSLPSITSVDPTLRCASLATNVTGSHPWIVTADDLIVRGNNNPNGYEKARHFIEESMALLPSFGWMETLCTRYNDADPYGDIIRGELMGKQGKFEVKVLSCWVDDDESKGPIWIRKKRWNSKEESGYTKEQLLNTKHTMGSFFNSQFRNDPAPEEEQVINVKDINTYPPTHSLPVGPPISVGIDGTGGGALVATTVGERLQELSLDMPCEEIYYEKGKRSPDGEIDTKLDRIISTCEPIITSGQLFVPEEWIKDAVYKHDDSLFTHEVYRLGAARWDDQIDCYHMIEQYLIKGSHPLPGQPAEVWIGADPSFSESATSDWTVIMAVAVTSDQRRYILGRERFKSKSPKVIADKIISFYRKHAEPAHTPNYRQRRQGKRKKKSFGASYN